MTAPAQAYSAEHGIRRYNVEGMHPHPISVTSLLKVIAPPGGLVTWMDKKLIRAALEAYDKSTDKEHAVTVGTKARWAGSEEADFGSSVHALTEQADLKKLGKIDTITPVADMRRAVGFLRQWEKMRDGFEMQIIAVEVTLVNTKLGYAGTADRIVIVPSISQNPIVLDIKSGKSVYPDVAMQCAGLSRCDKILYNDGTLHDIPWELDQTVGVAAHVRARSGHLYPLDTAKAWPIFESLPQLALWKAEQIPVIGPPLTPNAVAHLRADLRLRMTQLPPDLKASVKDIVAMHSSLVDGNTNTWSEDELKKVESIFLPFENQARERFEEVILKWGDRGSNELKSAVMNLTQGRTSSVAELTSVEVDELVKGF